MATARRAHTAYAPLFGAITPADAHTEPEADQLFVERGKITVQTTVILEGFTLQVTLNDTSLSEAIALMQRRGCTPAGAAPPAPIQPRPVPATRGRPRKFGPAPTPKPAYRAVWLDLD